MTERARGPDVEFRLSADLPSADDPLTMQALLATAQVAEVFNRSKRTLRDWVRAGHLRPVRVGRAVFFRADDVRALIEAGGP